MARLTADFWVRAYLARLGQAGIPAFIARKGDATAGAVVVKVSTLDGRASALHRSFDPLSGARSWVTLAEGAEAEVEAALGRQGRYDPDLWVVEVEDPRGRHLLDTPGLEA